MRQKTSKMPNERTKKSKKAYVLLKVASPERRRKYHMHCVQKGTNMTEDLNRYIEKVAGR